MNAKDNLYIYFNKFHYLPGPTYVPDAELDSLAHCHILSTIFQHFVKRKK